MINQEFDVIVAGAGPAGCTFALAMQPTSLKIALVDKAHFPRDKVCGDAIPGRAVRILRQISAQESQSFDQFAKKNRIRGGKAVAPNQHSLSIFYQNEGYTATRYDFDHYLFQRVSTYSNITIFQGAQIQKVNISAEKAKVELANGQCLSAKLIIGCDGANSVVARQLSDRQIDYDHHCAAVRAYYRGIEMDRSDVLEIFLLKDYLPGYFWIFPLTDGLFNVGFGMLSADIRKKRINMRQSFCELIAQEPTLRRHFQNAKQVSALKGFGLPLGSKKEPISGERFMLCGDAAALIDPVTGEGIGNAMLSASLAASVAQNCFEANRFDADFLKAYDRSLFGKTGKEMSQKTFIQKLLKDRHWLINFCIYQAANNPLVKRIVKKII